jgi:hypothetical protein
MNLPRNKRQNLSKRILNETNMFYSYELDLLSSGYGQVAGSGEESNEPSAFIKGVELLTY